MSLNKSILYKILIILILDHIVFLIELSVHNYFLKFLLFSKPQNIKKMRTLLSCKLG